MGSGEGEWRRGVAKGSGKRFHTAKQKQIIMISKNSSCENSSCENSSECSSRENSSCLSVNDFVFITNITFD